jgi:hypothetical protein
LRPLSDVAFWAGAAVVAIMAITILLFVKRLLRS